MCGITGAAWTDPAKAVDLPVLRRMTEALRHRGPDELGERLSDWRPSQGTGVTPGVALGFRRLSIIDVEGGHQPMSNEDGTVWVLFNGEIYNYGDLRHRLEGSGHTFRTHCDTEAIVHLYEDEGPDCFSHLNGMFAIAIWDERNRRVVLGRDRLGKKPLVYWHEPDRLCFASELKSLSELPDFPREIDPAAIDQYLTYQYIPHPRTIYRHVKKLPPGHRAIYHDDGRLDIRSYWSFDPSREQDRSLPDWIDELRETLTSAVRLRLQSEVPLGAFLSGGVDSSLIVALMQQELDRPVKTFNIGFAEKAFDESPYAWQVARHLRTDHQHFQVRPDAVAILPDLVRQYDEPFGDSSAIPTWLLSQATRRHVTVALTGDGGDELFAGYDRYRVMWFGGLIEGAPPLRQLISHPIWQRIPGGGRRGLIRSALRFSESLRDASPGRRYLQLVTFFGEAQRAALYQDDFLATLPDEDPAEFLAASWRRVGRRDPVSQASLTDLLTYLPCDLMTKVDMASMAHSLECRSPFLDVRVVELAAAMPVSLKVRDGKKKWILQRAFGDLLPRAIWKRRKMGFGVPLPQWFRHELRPMVRETLLGRDALCHEYLRPDVIAEYVRQHERSQFDHSLRLWALLVLEQWLRTWKPAPALASAGSRLK